MVSSIRSPMMDFPTRNDRNESRLNGPRYGDLMLSVPGGVGRASNSITTRPAFASRSTSPPGSINDELGRVSIIRTVGIAEAMRLGMAIYPESIALLSLAME